MLEEFYILKETNLFYYYSKKDENIDFNQVILSTGLLSALNSFTYSSRQNSINSFQTESEIFKFTKIQDERFDLVFVFNLKDYNNKNAELIIQNILDLINNTNFLKKETNYIDLNNPHYLDLTNSIKYILEFEIPKQVTDKNLNELLSSKNSIDYCAIKDSQTGNVLAKYSKRASFLQNNFENDHDLILSVIKTSLKNLELAELYLVISFQGESHQFQIFNMEEYTISILSSEIKPSSFYTDLLKNFMPSKNLFQYAKYKLADFRINSKYIREETGKIVFREGIILSPKMSIYLGTLTHNIMNFTKLFLPKGLKGFSIVYVSPKNELSLLKATLLDGKMEVTINND